MPEISFHASIRSSRERMGVSESVPCFSCQRSAREVVDDGDLVPAGREAHRRRPAEIAVAPENEDAHVRAAGYSPIGRTVTPGRYIGAGLFWPPP